MKESSLFIDKEDVLIINKKLVMVLGNLNEAIVLNQLNYWIHHINDIQNHFHDGKVWVYNSYADWVNGNFPFWSVDTVKRTITQLEKKGIVISGNYNKVKIDRTKWYTIDYDRLEEMKKVLESQQNTPLGQNAPMDRADCTEEKGNLHQAIPENTTDNTTKITDTKGDTSSWKTTDDATYPPPSDDKNLEKLERNAKAVIGEEATPRFMEIARYFLVQYFYKYGEHHRIMTNKACVQIAEQYFKYPDIDSPYNIDFSYFDEDGVYEDVIDKYFLQENWKAEIELSMSHFFSDGIRARLLMRL